MIDAMYMRCIPPNKSRTKRALDPDYTTSLMLAPIRDLTIAPPGFVPYTGRMPFILMITLSCALGLGRELSITLKLSPESLRQSLMFLMIFYQ